MFETSALTVGHTATAIVQRRDVDHPLVFALPTARSKTVCMGPTCQCYCTVQALTGVPPFSWAA